MNNVTHESNLIGSALNTVTTIKDEQDGSLLETQDMTTSQQYQMEDGKYIVKIELTHTQESRKSEADICLSSEQVRILSDVLLQLALNLESANA